MRDRGGYQDSPYLDRQRGLRGPLPTSTLLILLCVAVFVVQIFAWALARVNLAYYLGVRADLAVGRLWVWQVFTYQFLHDPAWIWHIVFNLYVLHAFGTLVESLLGRRQFLALYLGGGVAGGVAYCALQSLPGVHAQAVGASAAVMALVIFYACRFPNQVMLLFFLVPVRAKWAAAILVGIDVLGAIGAYGGDVAHAAHLGGALFGWLYARFAARIATHLDARKSLRRDRQAERPARDEQRLDDLLAKITREGFGGLTARERRFLQEQSRHRNDRIR